MTKIIVTSDLHLGITSEKTLEELAAAIAAQSPDLTVLAGDLGEPLQHFIRCLKIFSAIPGEVAVLAGNHDVWSGDGHASQALWEHTLPDTVRAMQMIWLEETIWQCEGLAVVGSLAWYDYSAVDPVIAPLSPQFYASNKGKYNQDAHHIDWDWDDPALATRLGDGLYERLQIVEQDDSVQEVIVVTHVPLFPEQMHRKSGDTRWGFSNAYFGNLTLGERIKGMPKLTRVISGHTHIGKEAIVERVNVAPLAVTVIASNYNTPTYVVAESEL